MAEKTAKPIKTKANSENLLSVASLLVEIIQVRVT